MGSINGDGTADWQGWLARHGAALILFARQWASSHADAEDAVQEAFARASTRWARLRDYDAPEAWVRRVAFNLATSGLRRARRQLAALARLGAPAAEPRRSTDRLAIEAGLRRLPLHHRQVLVLYYGADLPVEQVAQQLRLPTGTVKSRLARARAALGVHLEEGQEERGHARG